MRNGNKNGLNKDKNPEVYKACKIVGGVTKLAKLLNISYTGISKWLNNKRPVPVKYAVAIERITNGKVKAKDLRPDIFL